MTSRVRKLVIGTVVLGGVAYGASTILYSNRHAKKTFGHVTATDRLSSRPKGQLLSRAEQLDNLRKTHFDVLVVGGGATGAGCALDAVTRGLKTAMVDMDDFSSGTSSRSTKLIHGGVRYLQKAIMQFDTEQYNMVKEALFERANLLEIAPHLSYPLPIMLPVYKWWQVPYYWFGIKMYDIVAGSKCLKNSFYLPKAEALEKFPMLRGDRLCGALVYYDGQHNDARMNLTIALTAARYGATIANHVKVVNLLKCKTPEGERVCGARVRDEVTLAEWDVKAKCVINATGPFTDSLRKMDDPAVKEICAPSAGVHITLPGYYSPAEMGLLDPSTSDGRVIFFLPWQKLTIAGTTDTPCEVTHHPSPTEEDIQFILNEIKNYLSPDLEVRRGDVLSAWSGIRPLVYNPNKADTQSLARNHIVHVSPNKLVTIAGGKWTTYRSMATDTIDTCIIECDLKPLHECRTAGLLLEGAHGWTPTMFIRLVQDFGLETEVAKHLANTYGDRAFSVAKVAGLTGKRWPVVGCRLHEEFPYIDAEVRYAIKEYACTAVDLIARRLRIAFLNVQAAEETLPRIVDIMGEELKWSEAEKKRQHKMALDFLHTEMGQNVNRACRDKMPINLTKQEISSYIKRFESLDKDKKGYISINDIRRSFQTQGIKIDGSRMHKVLNEVDLNAHGQVDLSEFIQKAGEEISGETIHEILRELDTNMNGQVELEEYLEMMSAIKSGVVVHSRFAKMAEMEEQMQESERRKKAITVERSGGGL